MNCARDPRDRHQDLLFLRKEKEVQALFGGSSGHFLIHAKHAIQPRLGCGGLWLEPGEESQPFLGKKRILHETRVKASFPIPFCRGFGPRHISRSARMVSMAYLFLY